MLDTKKETIKKYIESMTYDNCQSFFKEANGGKEQAKIMQSTRQMVASKVEDLYGSGAYSTHISEDQIVVDGLMTVSFSNPEVQVVFVGQEEPTLDKEIAILQNVQKRGYAKDLDAKTLRLQVVKLLEEAIELTMACGALDNAEFAESNVIYEVLASEYRKIFINRDVPDSELSDAQMEEVKKELADCIIPLVIAGKCVSPEFSVMEQSVLKSAADVKRGVRA
jgi:phosphoribosyl-ATP pyrophosphohydrolase